MSIWSEIKIDEIPSNASYFRAVDRVVEQENSPAVLCKDWFQGYHLEREDNINISGILTRLIQNVGRFCEHYASDLLYDLAQVDAFLQPYDITSDNRWVLVFGIRESGVDGAFFTSSRIKSEGKDRYRKILALDIQDKLVSSERRFTLVDITDEIRLSDFA